MLWNAQWYGGHHAAGYSLLFPPLAGLVGPRAVGVIAGVAAVLAVRLAGAPAAARTRSSAAVATWLFASGIITNVSSGGCRSPSASPARSPRGRARCARRGGGRRRGARLGRGARRPGARRDGRRRPVGPGARADGELARSPGDGRRAGRGSARARRHGSRARGLGAGAGALAFAATWASPVAGLFLCTAALGPAIAAGPPDACARRCSSARRAWPGWRSRSRSRRAGRTASWRPRSGRCSRSASGRRSMLADAPARGARGRGRLPRRCSSGRSCSTRRWGRTRCGPGCCSARRCSRSTRTRARRACCWSWRSGCSSTCSGCRPCARSTEASGDPATKQAFYAAAPRAARAARAGRATGSRCRSRATTGRPPTSRRTSRWPAAGTASSTARPTASSTATAGSTRRSYLRLAARRGRALGRAARRARSTTPPSPRRAILRAGVPGLTARLALAGLARVGGRRLAPGRRPGAHDRSSTRRASSWSPPARARRYVRAALDAVLDGDAAATRAWRRSPGGLTLVRAARAERIRGARAALAARPRCASRARCPK